MLKMILQRTMNKMITIMMTIEITATGDFFSVMYLLCIQDIIMVLGTITIGGLTGTATRTTEITVTQPADITILGVITVLTFIITGLTMETTGIITTGHTIQSTETMLHLV